MARGIQLESKEDIRKRLGRSPVKVMPLSWHGRKATGCNGTSAEEACIATPAFLFIAPPSLDGLAPPVPRLQI